MNAVARRRPPIPADYGIATDEAGMLEWDDVAGALATAPVYWVATTLPAGGPHLIPIWGAFTDGAAYFEGGDTTRWARNLAGDDRVHVGVDHSGMQVMVRGRATPVDADGGLQSAIADGYSAKYPYRPTGSRFWCLRPDRVLAWKTDDIEAFATTPTQFEFGGAS